MKISDFKQCYSCGNKTTFIDEQHKTMVVVFTKNILNLNDIDFNSDFNLLVSTNDRYTKYSSISNNAQCEYIVITNYTQQDYYKHTTSIRTMIVETPEIYKTITLPNAQKMDKKWIYDILDGKAEQERILYQDDLFVLIKDIKWTNCNLNEMHLLALPRDRSLMSIRDLDGSNIELINSMDNISRNIISKTYGFDNNKIRSYFHYYPSYWHLHIHFDMCGNLTTSDSIDFCRSLFDVVENIKFDSDYYKKITLNVVDYFN